LAIARSYSLSGNSVNALALIKHAFDLGEEAHPGLSNLGHRSGSSPLDVIVTVDDVQSLGNILIGELQLSRALVEISNLQNQPIANSGREKSSALAERLSEYPAEGVDLENIAVYPPKTEAIPVKPLFLDIAWNYILYPDKQTKQDQEGTGKVAQPVTKMEEQAKPQKKGWFGFGR
jgi:signal recognition particle subunit SRP68